MNKDVLYFVSSFSADFIEMHLFVLSTGYVYLFVVVNVGQTGNKTRYFRVEIWQTSTGKRETLKYYSTGALSEKESKWFNIKCYCVMS